MSAAGWIQMALYFLALLVLARPLGAYMARVFEGRAALAGRVLGPVERLVYRVSGVRPDEEMTWKTYAVSMLAFQVVGFVFVFLLQRLQALLPLNPQRLGAVSADSSFNTAVSFVTNTNWQGYSGETTMSHLTQALGLAVQNFVSAATGMAVLVALVRGLTRRQTDRLGSFWVDVTRSALYVLLPLSAVLAVVLVSQGVVQTFSGHATARVLQAGGEGSRVVDQILALGPAASQTAIKQLGTNGGGFFNVNSAHPFENPTALSGFLQCLAILLIPAALCFTFGRLVGEPRQGRALLAAMTILLVPLVIGAAFAEDASNPMFRDIGADDGALGNMEGKETRFGVAGSVLWAAATTAASNGSVNSMHDSMTPLGGMIPLGLMQVGEVVFGGVGSGLYGMLLFGFVAVFIAGLMVGRTPEYLGKKIEAFEVKMSVLGILAPSLAVLVGAAIALVTSAGKAGISTPSIHGYTEVLYAFASAGNNNGSAFAGLGANTPFYNTALGLAMLVGRYFVALPVLAIAGSLAKKKTVPVGPGTLPTHTPLFVGMLVGVVLLIGALTFLPSLALGPIAEHLQMEAP